MANISMRGLDNLGATLNQVLSSRQTVLASEPGDELREEYMERLRLLKTRLDFLQMQARDLILEAEISENGGVEALNHHPVSHALNPDSERFNAEFYRGMKEIIPVVKEDFQSGATEHNPNLAVQLLENLRLFVASHLERNARAPIESAYLLHFRASPIAASHASAADQMTQACFSIYQGHWAATDFCACTKAKEVIKYDPSRSRKVDQLLLPLLARVRERPRRTQPGGLYQRTLRNAWDVEGMIERLELTVSRAVEAEAALKKLVEEQIDSSVDGFNEEES